MASKRGTSSSNRRFDVVVWGATGFTGRLAAKYLAKKWAAKAEDFTLAFAGRNHSKLSEVRDLIAREVPQAKEIELLVGDSGNQASIDAIVQQARVVLAAVGPYTLYGMPVVDACVRLGTHYCDITGELNFVSDTIRKYDAQAKENGVCIVSCCGFDCIPSDLGVLYHLEAAKEKGLDVSSVRGYLKLKGAASGGTLNSVFTIMEQPWEVLKEGLHPYSLIPREKRPTATSFDADPKVPSFSSDVKSWTTPFPLATGDVRVVRRSAHLLGYADNKFHYNESYQHGSIIVAFLFWISLLVGMTLASIKFTRNILRKYVPQPGEGPSEKVMREGYMRVTHVSHPNGNTFTTSVSGGEPGYYETSRMSSEAALCLALDKLPAAGVLTPAACMGMALVRRLQTIGIKFQTL